MLAPYRADNLLDDDGNPSGGKVLGTGLRIHWQDGPLGRGDERKEPNGAFVETVVAACVERLEFYQEASDGKFACEENAEAIAHFKAGLAVLEARDRQAGGRRRRGHPCRGPTGRVIGPFEGMGSVVKPAPARGSTPER